jgi:hypothetical protein
MTINTRNEFTVGKTKVAVLVTGCVDCGNTESIGAEQAQHLMFRLGDRNYRIEFKRCADCSEKKGARWPSEMRAGSNSQSSELQRNTVNAR